MDSFKFARRPRVHSYDSVSVYPGWMGTHIVSTAANPTYPNVMGMCAAAVSSPSVGNAIDK